MKSFFIDVETTGLDPKKNGIIQIAGIIEIDGKEVETINYQVKPFSQDEVDPKALAVNGISLEELSKYPQPKAVYTSLKLQLNKFIDKYDKRDKFQFIGYNSRFDDDFMREWFRKNGDNFYGSYFHWPSIDVANMAATKFLDKRASFPNFKLMTVAASCGLTIEMDKLHDAMYDIELTKDLFYVLLGNRP